MIFLKIAQFALKCVLYYLAVFISLVFIIFFVAQLMPKDIFDYWNQLIWGPISISGLYFGLMAIIITPIVMILLKSTTK